jgi:hypothetical protein
MRFLILNPSQGNDKKADQIKTIHPQIQKDKTAETIHNQLIKMEVIFSTHAS